MEVDQLRNFVLVLLLTGIILGVGVLILDKFGTAVKTPSSVVNESITVSSNTVTLANRFITGISYFGNFTNNTVSYPAIYLVGTTINVSTETGVITTAGNIPNAVYNISYSYNANTTSSNVLDASVSAIKPIATTWLGLIVTVAVLAIILTLVIKSFTAKRE